jgi:sulfur carrier protein ThiS
MLSHCREGLFMSLPPPGHNTADLTIQTELKLFNSLASHNGAPLEPQVITIAAGSTVGDLLRKIELPARRVFLAFIDGHDITPRLEGGIESDHPLQDGDVVALSRPIPYSWGYGSPVV